MTTKKLHTARTSSKLYTTDIKDQMSDVLGSGTYGSITVLKPPNDNNVSKTWPNYDTITADMLMELGICQLIQNLPNLSGCVNFGHDHSPGKRDYKVYYKRYNSNADQYLINLYTGPNNSDFKLRHDFMWKLCVGIYWLHYRFIVHADLKPQNILCNINGDVAITDFGLSKFIFPHVTNIGTNYNYVVQTITHRSPEVFLDMKYDQKSDIWSLGLILLEIMISNFETSNTIDKFTGNNIVKHTCTRFQWLPNVKKTTYHDHDEPYVLEFIFKTFGKPNEPDWITQAHRSRWFKHYSSLFNSIPNKPVQSIRELLLTHTKIPITNIKSEQFDQFVDLLEHMLVVNQTNRYSIDQVVSHPFFSSFDQNPYIELNQQIIESPTLRVTDIDTLPNSGYYGNWSKFNNGIDRSIFRLTSLVCLGYCDEVKLCVDGFFYIMKMFEKVLTLTTSPIDLKKHMLIMTTLIHFYDNIYENGSLNHRSIYTSVTNHFVKHLGKASYFYITFDEFNNVEEELLILLEGDICVPHELSYLRVILNNYKFEFSQDIIKQIIYALLYLKIESNALKITDDSLSINETIKISGILQAAKIIFALPHELNLNLIDDHQIFDTLFDITHKISFDVDSLDKTAITYISKINII